MANCCDSLTLASTGSSVGITMPVTFTPNKLTFEVGSKSGSTTSSSICLGTVDSGGYMTYLTTARDNSTSTVKNADGTNKCVSIWEWVSGAWTEVMSISFVSFTSTGFNLNIASVNANYKIKYFAEN